MVQCYNGKWQKITPSYKLRFHEGRRFLRARGFREVYDGLESWEKKKTTKGKKSRDLVQGNSQFFYYSSLQFTYLPPPAPVTRATRPSNLTAISPAHCTLGGNLGWILYIITSVAELIIFGRLRPFRISLAPTHKLFCVLSLKCFIFSKIHRRLSLTKNKSQTLQNITLNIRYIQ